MSLETSRKGSIAEHKVISAALEKGYFISKPINDLRYDLIFEKDNKFLKVQVKYCDSKVRGASILVYFIKCYYKKNAKHLIKTYSKDEIDLILVYFPTFDKILCFNSDIFHLKSTINIRFKESQAKQKNFNWFEDFLF